MRARTLFIVSALMLCGCMKAHRPALVEAEPSLVFPSFFASTGETVGSPGRAYALDGSVLRALTLAVADFLPPATPSTPCWDRPESHRYSILREPGVIFIRIEEDPTACGRQVPALHSGARYAFSDDGRLLRRLMDGEPEQVPDEAPSQDDTGEDAAPGTPPAPGPQPGGPPPRFSHAPDGGTRAMMPAPPIESRLPPDGGPGIP
ncbi:hypothetical protein [Corallococcus exercitus]|uniref:Lipoprotein n=1 Tax=Corallococcus exercitus TaxID=2316736 RepID=A0A7Y4NHM2_9BACT|nr:hypothetical protein [Corallococcus exercitus]NOK14798.1 hypothetical protein [Corallococcus exercitus]